MAQWRKVFTGTFTYAQADKALYLRSTYNTQGVPASGRFFLKVLDVGHTNLLIILLLLDMSLFVSIIRGEDLQRHPEAYQCAWARFILDDGVAHDT